MWRNTDLSIMQKQNISRKKTAADLLKMPFSLVDLFECSFDNEILETFAEFSKIYARSKGNMTFKTTPEENQTFFAILLLSGYTPVPRKRMYWSSDEDVGKDSVQAAMSRNCFEEMLRYFHVSDNAHLDVAHKMSKVWPLLTHCCMNEKLLTYFKAVQTQNLSINRSILPYYCFKQDWSASTSNSKDMVKGLIKANLHSSAIHDPSLQQHYGRCGPHRSEYCKVQNSNSLLREFVSFDKRVQAEVRFDHVDHLVQSWPTQLRCASCGKKTMRGCAKCKVGLHDKCFQQYHTLWNS